MNVSARIAEIDGFIEASLAAGRQKAAAYNGPDRALNSKRIGQQVGAACAELSRERAALQAPIVALTVFQDRLFLATSGGMFEVKGENLVFVPLSASA